MFKMIANRGSGKTTSLMYHADLLAKENPDKQVLFVTSQPQLMVRRFLELSGSDHLPQNLGFISYSYFLVKIKDLKDYIAVVDELDYWLQQFQIVGYTNTIETGIFNR